MTKVLHDTQSDECHSHHHTTTDGQLFIASEHSHPPTPISHTNISKLNFMKNKQQQQKSNTYSSNDKSTPRCLIPLKQLPPSHHRQRPIVHRVRDPHHSCSGNSGQIPNLQAQKKKHKKKNTQIKANKTIQKEMSVLGMISRANHCAHINLFRTSHPLPLHTYFFAK